MEALAYYKSIELDPSIGLFIQYKGEAAVDTGGVLKQFSNDVFIQMVDACKEIPQLFIDVNNKEKHLYLMNSSILMSGMIGAVGKIMAHVSAGVGTKCLSPAVVSSL